jgi:hypothetical protein
VERNKGVRKEMILKCGDEEGIGGRNEVNIV